MTTRVYVKVALDFNTDLDSVTMSDIENAYNNVSLHDLKRAFADADEEDIQEDS